MTVSVRSAAVSAAALLAAAALAGCSTLTGDAVDAVPTSGLDIPSVSPVVPLPAGATAAPNTQTSAPSPPADCTGATTLHPVDVPPDVLVPGIKARGRIIVGTDQGSNLFSFRDPVSGQLVGFDVDIAHEIARDIFGDPGAVEFRSLTSGDRVQALMRGDVDIVVKSMSITCDREQSIAFSAPYFQAYQRVLAVRGSGIEGLGDLRGKRVCVAAGTTSATRLLAEVPNVTVLTVDSWADCLVAIQQRQVDAITTDDAILAGIAAQDPYLEIVGPDIAAEPYGVGISLPSPTNDTTGLIRQVNRTLARIGRDGTWTTIYNRWLTSLGPAPGEPKANYSDGPAQ